MIPFFKYPGGKMSELPLVQKYKPEVITRYFEPFLGGASIYLNMNIKDSFVNDYSKDLFDLYVAIKDQNKRIKSFLVNINNLWKKIEKDVLKDDFDAVGLDYDKFIKYQENSLKRKNKTLENISKEKDLMDKSFDMMKETSYKTAFYMLMRDLYNEDKTYKKTAAFFFLREYCYSSMFRFSKTGKFNVPYGGYSYNKKYMDIKIMHMFNDETKKYFENTSIYNLDFEKFFNLFDFDEDDFIFLDPPYDSDFSTYDNNSFGRNEQVRLRDCLSKIKAKWMLIIKKTDFIYDLYKDFKIYEYDMKYMVSFKNRNKKDVKHLLITNYEIKEYK